ncbi:MAG: DUF4373 domain-containing protein [Tissierellales bacterium]|nr:DUF4373 domain-containing protein [Tissierellales bacterium]
MARPQKTGIEYFPFDIDFFNDEKVQFISAKYGEFGELILIKLLCKIYRNGYFIQWGEDECLLFAKNSGDNVTPELVNRVIEECMERNFFNRQKFEDYQILTSSGIQKRYFEAIKRRKNIVIIQNYLINGVNDNINRDNVNINLINVDIGTQSKVKKSKVTKKIKDIIINKKTKKL